MLNIYDSIRNDEGNIVTGRTKLFVLNVDKDNNIGNFNHGPYVVPEDSGNLFIVDKYVIEQIDKLELVDGQLVVKDGETIEGPKKTELQLEEERLQQQLDAIRAKRTEEES